MFNSQQLARNRQTFWHVKPPLPIRIRNFWQGCG